eukprot:gene31-4282_t
MFSSNIFNQENTQGQQNQQKNQPNFNTKRNEIQGLLSPSELLNEKPPPIDAIFKNILQNQPGPSPQKQENSFTFPNQNSLNKSKDNFFDTSSIKIHEVPEIKESHDASINLMKSFEQNNFQHQKLPFSTQVNEPDTGSDRLESMFLSFGENVQLKNSLSEILKPNALQQPPPVYKPQQSHIHSSSEPHKNSQQNSGNLNYPGSTSFNRTGQSYSPSYQRQQPQQNNYSNYSQRPPSYTQSQQYYSNPMMGSLQYQQRYGNQNSPYGSGGLGNPYQNPYSSYQNQLYQSSQNQSNSNSRLYSSSSPYQTNNGMSSYNTSSSSSSSNSRYQNNHRRRSIDNESIEQKMKKLSSPSSRKPMGMNNKKKKEVKKPNSTQSNRRKPSSRMTRLDDYSLDENEKVSTDDFSEDSEVLASGSDSEDEFLENSKNFSFSNLSLKMFSDTAYRYENYKELMKEQIKKRILNLIPETEKKKKEKEIESLFMDPMIELNVYNSVCHTPSRKKKPIGFDVYELIDVHNFNLLKEEQNEEEEKKIKIENQSETITNNNQSDEKIKQESYDLFEELNNISDEKIKLLGKAIPFEIDQNDEMDEKLIDIPTQPVFDKRKKNKIMKTFQERVNPFLEKKDVENDLSLIFESSVRRSQRIALKDHDGDTSSGVDSSEEDEYYYSKGRKRKRNYDESRTSNKRAY